MARAKKGEDKADGKGKDAAIIQVNIEDFVRTRDTVVSSLETLKSAVEDLSRAYIVHTNSVLSGPGSNLEIASLSNNLTAGSGLGAGTVGDAAVAADGEPKKKKKRAHDPNAPKRPLTPYFLYMQSARPIIAKDLGENAKPGDVSAEGTKRWKEMPLKESELWSEAYHKNLAEYQDRVKAYKASLSGTDPAAAQLAAENGAVTADEEEFVIVPEPEPERSILKAVSPSKEKAKKARRKSAKDSEPGATPAEKSKVKETRIAPPVVKDTVSTPVSAAKEKTPGQKRKRGDKKSSAGSATVATPVAAAEPEAPKSVAKSAKAESATKDKRTKRKRKSDAPDA
ncbi:MAG: hypothetical protein M1825_000500 [Sarcosagium campestre]|nr:MAG: hypothetical protein M1825_000500 [Sarcosagium campestre]